MGKSNHVWRSDVAKGLFSTTGTTSIEDAIPILIDVKLSMFGVLRPPIDLRMVASRFGISSHFNYTPMTGSARLRPDGSNYVIDVNSANNEHRQRFSIAHEIGHKALLDRGIHITKHRGSVAYTAEEREEEEICDAIAAALLGLRPEYIHAKLNQIGFAFKAIEQVSNECKTSFEATLRAFLRYCEFATAGVYCEMHGGLIGGVADAFVVRRAYHSDSFTPIFVTSQLFSGVTCFREAMRQNGKIITTDEMIAVNGQFHAVHAEAKRTTIYVQEQPKVGVVMILRR